MQLRPFSDPLCLSPYEFLFPIHPPSYLPWLQQRHIVAKRGETGRELAAECCLSVSLAYLNGSLTCREVLGHGTDLLPLRKKSYYGFLSPLKFHRSRLGLNPQTLGPIASTITITPPITTFKT
jgi:hypothetical protein